MTAAQAVALHSDMLTGPEATIQNLQLPAKQKPDDAPRWAKTDQTISLWDYSTAEQLQGDGSAPLNVYFRIAPDIFYSERPNALLRLVYRYNSIPIGPISSMQVRINNAFLGSVPLIPGQEASKQMQSGCAGAGGEPAPVLQLAVLRFHLPIAEEGRVPGYDAHQYAGARFCATRSWICAAIRTTRLCPTWKFLRMRASRLRGWPT